MLRLDTEFENEKDGFYSWEEQQLEDEVCEFVCGTGKDISDEAAVYLSNYREQLISWYPFKDNARILELGAGFGQLTGQLCRKAEAVVAVEVKKSRSEIIKKRWSQYQNLEVLASSNLNYEGEIKFDYIFIHDVIPIIKKIVRCENPLYEFMCRVKNYLNEDGIVLFTAENRLGLKYFSGAVEEFSQKFFTGINQFDGYDRIRTYSLNELKDIFFKAGYRDMKTYYPFPDCIFPTEIFTEDILDVMYYGGQTKVTESERFQLFDEKRMFRVLQRENCLSVFVNAFFIELYRNKSDKKKDILYYNSGNSYVSEYSDPLYIFKENGKRKFSNKENIQCLPQGKRLDSVLIEILDSFWINSEVAIQQLETVFNNIYKDICLLIFDCKRESYQCDENSRNIEYVYGMPSKIRTEHFIYENSKLFPLQWDRTDNRVDIEYVLWDFVYSWYDNYVLGSKTFERIVDIYSLYRCLHIDVNHVGEFVKIRCLESKKGIQELYRDTYYADVCYAHDAIIKGVKIITEDLTERKQNSKIKKILAEKSILDQQKENFENEVNVGNKKMY